MQSRNLTHFRRLAPVAVIGWCMIVLLVGTVAQPSPSNDARPLNPSHDRFLGASTCGGPACHGRSEPSERARSQQTEFTTWSTKDRHSTAFAVLANEQSLEIARHLKLAEAPQQSVRCVNCHSMNVLDPARRGQDFKLADGVSCDGCHGPAERWLGTHLNEPYAESLQKGMADIRSPVRRAEMCVSCHVGNYAERKVVDHEMLAAGHPRLRFELDSFSRKMPAHWREKQVVGQNSPRAQMWAVGQLVALRAACRLLADAAQESWPEYAHFDCVSCHHELNVASWRQRRGPKGSTGRPVWGAIPDALMARQIIDEGAWTQSLDGLQRSFAPVAFGKPDQVAQSAVRLDEELVEWIESIQNQMFSDDEARKLAVRLCGVVGKIAGQGPAAAQQLTFALSSLVASQLPSDSPLHADLERLEKDLSDPAISTRYDPAEFARRVSAICQCLK